MRKILLLFALVALCCLASCRQTDTPTPNGAAPAATITITTNPDPPIIGESTLTISLTQDGAPLANAPVSLRGDMNMAGMKPVLADVTTGDDGTVDVPFSWSMGGDWIVTVTVTLADGSQVSQDFNYTVAT